MIFFKKYGISACIGILAGVINGLLGAGGGIIVTFYLSHALNDEQKQGNGVFAGAVAAMLPISVVSLGLYLAKGYVILDKDLITLLPSAIIGGIIGAFLLTKLKLKFVRLIFAILVTVSGVMMIAK